MSNAQPLTTAPESRVRFIEHEGKRILLHDFTNILEPREALPLVEQSKAIVAQQPAHSLLTVTCVSGSRFDRDIIEALKSLVVHNKPYVRHGAIVGLSGLQRVIYVTLTQLTGRRLPTFDTLDEAKAWLVRQP